MYQINDYTEPGSWHFCVSLCAGKMSSINVRDKNRSQLWSWTRPYRPSTSQTSFLDGLSKRWILYCLGFTPRLGVHSPVLQRKNSLRRLRRTPQALPQKVWHWLKSLLKEEKIKEQIDSMSSILKTRNYFGYPLIIVIFHIFCLLMFVIKTLSMVLNQIEAI